MDIFLTNQNNSCRTCMAQNVELTSVFSIINISNQEKTLHSMLQECVSIEIRKEDGLPQFICSGCFEKLVICYLFRELCFSSQAKFRESAKNESEAARKDLPLQEPIVREFSEINVASEENINLTLRREECLKNLAFDSDDDDDFIDEGKCDIDIRDNSCDIDEKSLDSIPAGNKYCCNVCSKVFANRDSLYKHSKLHSNSEDLRCKICMKQFSRIFDVKRHMSSHTGDKPFTCTVCHTSFTQSGTLAVHMRKHEGVKRLKKLKIKREETHRYLCSICGAKYKDSNSLTTHVRNHLGQKPYECEVCNKKKWDKDSYPSTSSPLTLLPLPYRRSYNQNRCLPSRFLTSGRLTSHSRIHSGEKPFICNTCGGRFAHASVLERHMKSHAGIKPYQCNICQKGFSSPYYLNIHKRLHTGEKPHKCEVCKKCFSDPKNLKQHALIHKDDKPFLCITCGKAFRRSHHLKIHMNMHSRGK